MKIKFTERLALELSILSVLVLLPLTSLLTAHWCGQKFSRDMSTFAMSNSMVSLDIVENIENGNIDKAATVARSMSYAMAYTAIGFNKQSWQPPLSDFIIELRSYMENHNFPTNPPIYHLLIREIDNSDDSSGTLFESQTRYL